MDSDHFKIFLMFALAGVLIFLLYQSIFQQKQRITNIDDLVKCINLEGCKGKNCPPIPPYCAQLKTEKKEEKNNLTLEKLTSRFFKLFKDDKEKKSQPPKQDTVKSVEKSKIREAIKQKKHLARKKKEHARRKHQIEKELSAFKDIDFKFIEVGFNYTLRNIFLAVPLIAFGLSLGAIDFRSRLQTFALLTLATAVAAAFAGETVINNYHFLGPYLLLLGGGSLLLYEEQKSYILPVIGVIIGVFLGFTGASDAPSINKWFFIAGTLLAAGFIFLVFSIASQLFNQTWLTQIMNIMGGGMIAIALILFALETSGNS